MNPSIAIWLWWLMCTTAPSVECTRCGGRHPLSRCPWPVVEQERH
jgi:hypothetical protein